MTRIAPVAARHPGGRRDVNRWYTIPAARRSTPRRWEMSQTRWLANGSASDHCWRSTSEQAAPAMSTAPRSAARPAHRRTFGCALVKAPLDMRQALVERLARRPAVRGQRPRLRRRRVQRKPVRPQHRSGRRVHAALLRRHHTQRPVRAPRRPHRRTHNDVTTSIMSRTRSPAVSPGPTTSTRGPGGQRLVEVLHASLPARPPVGRTTTTVADGSDKTLAQLRLHALTSPEPSSHTTSATPRPCP